MLSLSFILWANLAKSECIDQLEKEYAVGWKNWKFSVENNSNNNKVKERISVTELKRELSL